MRVSVVTPSLNQAAFLERAIESVLGQRGDFELEHLVVDGGSTDGTRDVLQRYAERVSFTSEPDRGQSDALNKGFARATGDVLCWLNSDDSLLPGALAEVVRAFRDPGCRWLFGQCRIVDEQDREVRRPVTWYKNRKLRRYSYAALLIENFIPQPATFFRRDLLDQVGPLDAARWYSMDYDLWLRFGRVAEPGFLPRDLAVFRWHGASKSGSRYAQGSLEAAGTARRHATLREWWTVPLHYAHAAGLIAAYQAADLVASLRARR